MLPGAGAAGGGQVRLKQHGKVILKDHLEHCIVHAVEDGDTEMLTELSDAIDRFVK